MVGFTWPEMQSRRLTSFNLRKGIRCPRMRWEWRQFPEISGKCRHQSGKSWLVVIKAMNVRMVWFGGQSGPATQIATPCRLRVWQIKSPVWLVTDLFDIHIYGTCLNGGTVCIWKMLCGTRWETNRNLWRPRGGNDYTWNRMSRHPSRGTRTRRMNCRWEWASSDPSLPTRSWSSNSVQTQVRWIEFELGST